MENDIKAINVILLHKSKGKIIASPYEGFIGDDGKLLIEIKKNFFFSDSFELPFPSKAILINDTAYYIQKENGKYEPIILGLKVNLPKTIKVILDKINSNIELDEDEEKELAGYISLDKLAPTTDTAFANIYAENVEANVMNQLDKPKGKLEILAKYMPFIIPIIAIISLLILTASWNNNLTATQHLVNATHITVACQYNWNGTQALTNLTIVGGNNIVNSS